MNLNFSAKASMRMLCCLLALIGLSGLAQGAEKGLLWKLEAPGGTTSYLFGTMHSDDKRINNFSPVLRQALLESDSFMMETLPPQEPSIFLLPQGEQIASLLTENEFDKIRQLAEFHSMHIEAAMRMKPWLLAVVFDLPKPQTPYAQDVQLMTLAQDAGKRIEGLETPAQHFGAMDSISMDDQLVMLRAVLKRSQKQKQRDFDALLKAYLQGDTSKIAALDDTITGGMLPPALWKQMRVKLLDERNAHMAEVLTAKAEAGKVFAAVGASHLDGEGGLLSRLRAAGFKVSAINPAFAKGNAR